MAGPFSETTWSTTTASPDETRALGTALGAALLGGEVILLTGQLGAGKTTLTQGIAIGLGVSGYTKSPSFVLVNEYSGRVPLYHMDLFRIETAEEVWDLGLDDYLTSPAVLAVEWAERALAAFPEDRLRIALTPKLDESRGVIMTAEGPTAAAALDLLIRQWPPLAER
ncbi:MAG: tRNA (adenosine(37)-N6)-threonylcarbamoyltransferase complex ATPase subunit type 1 TsaE [Chloroflexi bacterium]|nr:tRNA (adenosine(37)-N6)-threonylcarbamoyltransferase complex ATPase subunit type 1 TsaE [Chloroflexota bacterium]